MTRPASSKTFPVSTRLPGDPFEHLLALAHRLNADPAEIMRRFVVNGLEANPVSDEERRTARERARLKARGELPGLVVPTSPLASAAGASGKVTEIHLADEHDEVRSGGENGILTRVRRAASSLRRPSRSVAPAVARTDRTSNFRQLHPLEGASAPPLRTVA